MEQRSINTCIFLFVADCAALQLKMMSKSYVMAKLDSMKGRADLNTVLQLTGEEPKHKKDTGEPQQPTPGSSKRKASEDSAQSSKKTLDASSFKSAAVKGTMPKKRKGGFTGGKEAAAIYGLRNWQEFTLLQEYLQLNGHYQVKYVPKDGSCMWRSMIECANYPAEYQPEMFQRQLVFFMAENADFLAPILSSHISGTYGCIRLSPEVYQQKEKDGTLTEEQKEDQRCPGPFSYITYLEYLLQRGSWGDYGVALSSSFMWQIRITTVVVDTTGDDESQWIRQELIRHDTSLKSTDMVLIFYGGNHYVPASKYEPR